MDVGDSTARRRYSRSSLVLTSWERGGAPVIGVTLEQFGNIKGGAEAQEVLQRLIANNPDQMLADVWDVPITFIRKLRKDLGIYKSKSGRIAHVEDARNVTWPSSVFSSAPREESVGFRVRLSGTFTGEALFDRLEDLEALVIEGPNKRYRFSISLEEVQD